MCFFSHLPCLLHCFKTWKWGFWFVFSDFVHKHWGGSPSIAASLCCPIPTEAPKGQIDTVASSCVLFLGVWSSGVTNYIFIIILFNLEGSWVLLKCGCGPTGGHQGAATYSPCVPSQPEAVSQFMNQFLSCNGTKKGKSQQQPEEQRQLLSSPSVCHLQRIKTRTREAGPGLGGGFQDVPTDWTWTVFHGGC